MRAAIYREFGGPITIETLPDPAPSRRGVIVEVEASGVCRSDVRGWRGRDPDVVLPHVPGHELAGRIVAVGADVTGLAIGQRMTTPFCGACGTCPTCLAGDTQICDDATQPGFTGWGSFAQFVAIENAMVNVVPLPDEVDMVTAALVGCRFITAYRAVVQRGRLQPGETLAVHGCGGVGLSAVMIGVALDCQVVAVDIDPHALALARSLGASSTVDGRVGDTAERVRNETGGGAHVSIDALGSAATAGNSIRSLRKLGRHVQAGLFHDDLPGIPMNVVVGRELELLGTHGMAGHRVPELLAMIVAGTLAPRALVKREIALTDVPAEFTAMHDGSASGVAVVTTFT